MVDCEEIMMGIWFVVLITVLASPVVLLYCLLYGLLIVQIAAADDAVSFNVDLVALLSQLAVALIVTALRILVRGRIAQRWLQLVFLAAVLGAGVTILLPLPNPVYGVIFGSASVMAIQLIFPSLLPSDDDDTHLIGIYALALDCLFALFSGLFQSALLAVRVGGSPPSFTGYNGTDKRGTLMIVYAVFASIFVILNIYVVVVAMDGSESSSADQSSANWMVAQLCAIAVLSICQSLPIGAENPESMAFIYVAGAQAAVFAFAKVASCYCCGPEKFELIFRITSMIVGVILLIIALCMKWVVVLAAFQVFESKIFFDSFQEDDLFSQLTHCAFLVSQAISAYLISARDVDMQIFLASGQSSCPEIESIVRQLAIIMMVVYALQIFVDSAVRIFPETLEKASLYSTLGLCAVGAIVSASFLGVLWRKTPVAEVVKFGTELAFAEICPGVSPEGGQTPNPRDGISYYVPPSYRDTLVDPDSVIFDWYAGVVDQKLQAELGILCAQCCLIACVAMGLVLATMLTYTCYDDAKYERELKRKRLAKQAQTPVTQIANT